jgi:hypothetical protein
MLRCKQDDKKGMGKLNKYPTVMSLPEDNQEVKRNKQLA